MLWCALEIHIGLALEFVDAAGADACALGLVSNTEGAPPAEQSSSSSPHAVCACIVLTTVKAGNGAGVVFDAAFCWLFAPQCASRAVIPSRTPTALVVVVVTWSPAGGAASSEAGVAMDSVCMVAVELAALSAYRRGGVSMGGLIDVVGEESAADVRAGCVVQVLSAGGAMRCCESRNAGRTVADVFETACAGHGKTSGSQCSGIWAAQAQMASRDLPGQRELVSEAS